MTQPADPDEGVHEVEEFDVDELAHRAGTTVRTVRMYAERGLLPPALRRGRRAAYRAEHLTRLRLVQRLADRGYSLAAIKDLTVAWDARHGLGHVLGLEAAVVEPLAETPPRRYSSEELLARFPDDADQSGLRRALAMGLLVADGAEFVAPSPTLLEAGAELVATGVPVGAALDVAEAILTASDALAERLVALFVEWLWRPFAAAGEPADGAATIAELIRRERPLAVSSVAAALAVAIDRHVDRAIMTEPASVPRPPPTTPAPSAVPGEATAP